MNDPKPIYFLEPVPPYNRGEIAGFEPKEADNYIRKRWAVPLDEAGEPILDFDPELAEPSLPEDFPGREALIEAGFTTLEAVREIEELTALPGIGKKTAAGILEALEAVEG